MQVRTRNESSTLSGPQISISSSYFPVCKKKSFLIENSPPAIAGDLKRKKNCHSHKRLTITRCDLIFGVWNYEYYQVLDKDGGHNC